MTDIFSLTKDIVIAHAKANGLPVPSDLKPDVKLDAPKKHHGHTQVIISSSADEIYRVDKSCTQHGGLFADRTYPFDDGKRMRFEVPTIEGLIDLIDHINEPSLSITVSGGKILLEW